MTNTDPLDLKWLDVDDIEELIDLSKLTTFAELLMEQFIEEEEITIREPTKEEGTLVELEMNRSNRSYSVMTEDITKTSNQFN